MCTHLPMPVWDDWFLCLASQYADERNIPTDRRTHTNLREFVDAWARHHNFWFSQPQPCFIYRYEVRSCLMMMVVVVVVFIAAGRSTG